MTRVFLSGTAVADRPAALKVLRAHTGRGLGELSAALAAGTVVSAVRLYENDHEAVAQASGPVCMHAADWRYAPPQARRPVLPAVTRSLGGGACQGIAPDRHTERTSSVPAWNASRQARRRTLPLEVRGKPPGGRIATAAIASP